MSHSIEVVCEHCEGTGTVTDYVARDIQLGSDEVPEHTVQVQCPTCLGQGHMRINPPLVDGGLTDSEKGGTV